MLRQGDHGAYVGAGPTVATVGLSMQVPLAVTLDAIFKRPAWLSSASSATLMFGGALLVLSGFFGISAESAKVDEEKAPHEPLQERDAPVTNAPVADSHV